MIGNPHAYYPNLAKPLGGLTAAILFSQIFYWQDKANSELGVYKTRDDLEEETGLTHDEQRTAIKKLVAIGVLLVTEKRLEHKTYYKIDEGKLNEILDNFANSKKGVSRDGENGAPEVDIVEFGESTLSSSFDQEITTKITEIYKPSLTLPSQNFDLKLILADSLRGEFQEFVDKSADELHRAVEQKIIGLGFECNREFRVQERGDCRSGRVDLLVSDKHGNQCGIEIDASSPREKSFAKLACLKSGIILLRKSSTAEDYLQDGVLVVAGGISLPKTKIITKKSELNLSLFEQKPSESVWDDYLQHRKNKKAPLTQTALNRLATAVNEANELGYSTDNVLAECMLRNWQGFEVSWIEQKKYQRNSLINEITTRPSNPEGFVVING
ncbi:hypothetical protein [Candidatus Arsenophonus triatominarum]|uniref:hypothetical protein n=1 Tax=Candidatus Arsenophonus triatominarum TaxID=57911 RepID=UPI00165086BD|nr:hypothetical protein [Candidatus Arsenophonus triatominarum]